MISKNKSQFLWVAIMSFMLMLSVVLTTAVMLPNMEVAYASESGGGGGGGGGGSGGSSSGGGDSSSSSGKTYTFDAEMRFSSCCGYLATIRIENLETRIVIDE